MIAQKSFNEDIVHSLVLEMKKNGMELTITSQKENGTRKPIKRLNYSHRVVVPYSEASVRSAKEH